MKKKMKEKKGGQEPKSSLRQRFLNKPGVKPLLTAGAVFLILVLAMVAFELYFWHRVTPGVYLGDLKLGGKSEQEARVALEQRLTARKDAAVVFKSEGQELFRLDGTRTLVGYDLEDTVGRAMKIGKNGDYLQQLRDRWMAIRYGSRLQPIYAYDQDQVYRALDEKLRPFESPVVDASFGLENGQVRLLDGQDGLEVDKHGLIDELGHFWAFTRESGVIQVSIWPKEQSIALDDLMGLESDVQTIASKNLVVTSAELFAQRFEVGGSELFELLSYGREGEVVELRFDEYKVAERFRALAEAVRREPVDALFELENGRASVFQPSLDGTALDTQRLATELLTVARDPQASNTVEAPLMRTPPAITTASVNEYGIKELVGTGRSSFRGSAAGRIHNVVLASQKLNGVLIAPDEVFSMHKVVGEIEKETGFRDAFVIKDGRTIPGVGGGVCQVSTTLFRVILDAGLPIVERRPHSYRVSYYEQDAAPGIDAAVYFPTWDLKFKNDTGNYLLLETKVDTKTLKAVYNLYGVSDGRKVEMTKPVVTGQTAPPPDLYIDDPNLERGKTVQDEHAAWGAVVSFKRTVTRNGVVVSDDVFKSAYKPWQAVFRVGVKDN